MKLYSLRLSARRPKGWDSGELRFGDHITQLYGPNGCGKTPIIQSIAYVLGYPTRYREDVIEHCDAVSLVLSGPQGQVALRRRIGSTFDAELTLPNGDSATYYNEKEYSGALADLFGFRFPQLTSTSNQATPPYTSTILPLFYVDQDLGYTGAYRAPASFIRDQYAEMMRLIFDLPPRNAFDRKKLQIEKRRRRDELDRIVVRKGERIEELLKELPHPRRALEQVEAALVAVSSRLEQLRSSRRFRSDAEEAIDERLASLEQRRIDISEEVADLVSRMRGFGGIQREIEAEVNALSLNEEARRLFASFSDICTTPNCGLFLGSSESYGKNLLYLKDQLKDLERVMASHEDRRNTLRSQLDQLLHQIEDVRGQRARLEASSEVAGLVDTISDQTRSLLDLQKERSALQEIAAEEGAYVRLLNERDFVQDELASLDSSATADLGSTRIRGELGGRVRHWLDVLQTKNVSRSLVVDSEFEVSFGNEKLSQFHGSTLLRVILALRAATFELYLKQESKGLRFLILDTPRQQDIEEGSLARFVAELKALCARANAQVVFSTTEYRYSPLSGDTEWVPTWPGIEQNMFLQEIEPGS